MHVHPGNCTRQPQLKFKVDGKLIDLKTSELLEKFGRGSHKPGSGSAAALQCMLAAQLIRTVIQLTIDRTPLENFSAEQHALNGIRLEIEQRLLPALEQMFHSDSEQFHRVIEARTRRDNENNPIQRQVYARVALNNLELATELPIEIANASLELARFGIQVFDHGWNAVRGDSGVAINAAMAATSGCLSIVALNLLSFSASAWTTKIRESTTRIQAELSSLQTQSQLRLTNQLLQAEKHESLHLEIKTICDSLKGELEGKSSSINSRIEQLVILLQRSIWRHRDAIWKTKGQASPLAVLKPERILKLLGFQVNYLTAIETHTEDEPGFEIAGEIDQKHKLVTVSRKFSSQVQNFTLAHELGHCLLHRQPVLHRDRPIVGSRAETESVPEEWQADRFAIYFLMPQKLVNKIFNEIFGVSQISISPETAMALGGRRESELKAEAKSLRGLSRIVAGAKFYNLAPIDAIATRFNVSIEAMAIRLEELELVRWQ